MTIKLSVAAILGAAALCGAAADGERDKFAAPSDAPKAEKNVAKFAMPSEALKAEIIRLENEATATDDWGKTLEIAKILHTNGFSKAAFSMSESVRHRIGDRSFDKFFATSGRVPLDEFPGFPENVDSMGKEESARAVENFLKEASAKNEDIRAYFEFCKRLEVAYSNKNDAVAKSEIAAIVPRIMKSPMLRRNAVVLPFIARSVLKVLEDKPLAEQLYLDLYFCDPHYYDGEFAEWRVNSMMNEERNEQWAEITKHFGGDLDASVRYAAWSEPIALMSYLDSIWEGGTNTIAQSDVPGILAGLESPFKMIGDAMAMGLAFYDYDLKPFTERIINMQKSPSYRMRGYAVILSKQVMEPKEYEVYLDECKKSDIKNVASAAERSDEFFSRVERAKEMIKTKRDADKAKPAEEE